MSTWKRDFASGLVVVVPILVILFVANWLYEQLLKIPFIPRITYENPPWWLAPWMEFLQVFLAVIVFVLLVLSVGYLMRTTSGRFLESFVDDTVNRVPGLRVVYNASKLAVETALTGTGELQKPVKLETWPGMRMTAFKTGKTTDDGRVVVFMPTAPNITTGFVIEVDPENVTETDERVEEALTRILSAGFGEGSDNGPVDVSDIADSAGAERGTADGDGAGGDGVGGDGDADADR
ncbi:DUF502 domain-containing protein [Halobaculum sp. D14]|uniref:DUF502 domain-containing protein n=1 Tax=Halobaculum sp. D14 TaxID=3421642 RepID=UPI003EBA73B8